jgi:molybdenum cofactor guanylyltransferase
MIGASGITGLVLAGGRGTRMGGVDKGLQNFRGTPLALNALMRLQMQEGGLIGDLMVNANRNLAAYEAFGHPVWPDTLADYAGPLAGFMTGLAHCETPWLLTVPCDTPLFPMDLVQRLASAFDDERTEIAMATALEEDGQLRHQPVFCLLRADLLDSLAAFTQAGGRKIDRWTDQHRTVVVPFDRPGDDPQAFFNANTLAELQSLEGG